MLHLQICTGLLGPGTPGPVVGLLTDMAAFGRKTTRWAAQFASLRPARASLHTYGAGNFRSSLRGLETLGLATRRGLLLGNITFGVALAPTFLSFAFPHLRILPCILLLAFALSLALLHRSFRSFAEGLLLRGAHLLEARFKHLQGVMLTLAANASFGLEL